MVQNKLALIGSVLLLGICMILFFPFPNNEKIDVHAEFMAIPIMDRDGYVGLGVVGSIVIMAALILLGMGLKKYRFRAILIAALTYLVLPYLLIWVYQETFAQGIYAISYDGKGSCDFEQTDENLLDGECSLDLHNHSNEKMTVEVEFIDSYFPGEYTQKESLMNVNGPLSIMLDANQKKTIHLKELLDLSNVPKHIDGGSFMNVNIKLTDGEKSRVL